VHKYESFVTPINLPPYVLNKYKSYPVIHDRARADGRCHLDLVVDWEEYEDLDLIDGRRYRNTCGVCRKDVRWPR